MSEGFLMRADKITVEEVDREYYVWLDERLLALTPQQAQQLADDLLRAMRVRWVPPLRRATPQRTSAWIRRDERTPLETGCAGSSSGASLRLA